MGGIATDLDGAATLPCRTPPASAPAPAPTAPTASCPTRCSTARVSTPRGHRRTRRRRRRSTWHRPTAEPARAAGRVRRRMRLDAGPARSAEGLERLLDWLWAQALSNPVTVSGEIASVVRPAGRVSVRTCALTGRSRAPRSRSHTDRDRARGGCRRGTSPPTRSSRPSSRRPPTSWAGAGVARIESAVEVIEAVDPAIRVK